MKETEAWGLGMQILPMHRHRQVSKGPVWIIVLVCLVSLFVICGYLYPPENSSTCYVFSTRGCKSFTEWLPSYSKRELTDEELASQVIVEEFLRTPPQPTENSKIAFMFMTPGSLPFEMLWDKFFSVRFFFILFLLYIESPFHALISTLLVASITNCCSMKLLYCFCYSNIAFYVGEPPSCILERISHFNWYGFQYKML